MNMKSFLLKHFLVVILLAGNSVVLIAQPVIHYPGTEQKLHERWKWAAPEAERHAWNHPYWVGYSIEKLMGENSFTGSFYSDSRRNKPSLCEILAVGPCIQERAMSRSMHDVTMSEGTISFDDEKRSVKKIIKEIGILFEISNTSSMQESFNTIVMSNFSLHAETKNEPILWLGPADDSESITFLQTLYDRQQSEKIQLRIVETIGMHESSDMVIAFLSRVLQDAEQASVREESAFWLGQTNSDKVLKLLLTVAEKDKSKNVREKAVFAISEMEGDKGVESLISLAREGKDREVRSKAMFWLGQKASEKAIATLGEIAGNDEDTEIQKSALYALTQLPDDRGIESLINVATTHRNPRLRKEAIYWLGQSEDKRALDVLIDIVRK